MTAVIDRRTAAREPDGVLCVADVEIRDLGLKIPSPRLWVLPSAELVDARWSVDWTAEGEAVGLSCRVTGTAEGAKRLEGRVAEVDILRGDEGAGGGGAGGAGLASLFEPVVTLRVPVRDGRIEAQWRVGYDAGGKARIATQPELDAVAERTGAEAVRYARPAWRFRVRLAGLVAESGEMGYRDHVDLAWDAETDRPAAGAPVEVRLADGTTREEALGEDGRLRLDDVPPGPVEATFGPDPRVWETPELGAELAAPDPLPDPPPFDAPPEPLVLLASAGLDPLLLAELAGSGPEGDDESWAEWLWGTLVGDFNEDAGYDQIVANIGASFVPGVGQVMDVRDVFAGLYLLTKDRGWLDWLKWLGLFATLVGIIPVLGDALKGFFRISLRSLRRGADDVAGAAAEALEAAFAKAKGVLEENGFSQLDGVESAAHLVRDLDVDRLVEGARAGIEGVTRRASYLFTWFAGVVESPFFRGHARAVEWLMGALSRVRAFADQAFRVDASRIPASPADPARLGVMLRGVADRIERLQAEANEHVARGLNELYDKLREIAGVPPRRPGAGVSGGTVTPAGSPGGGATRATPGVIAARRRAAEGFYKRNGYLDEVERNKQLRGIDFNHPVDVIPLSVGDRYRIYQGRQAWQGNYYYQGFETPSRLGISPVAEDKATKEILAKDIFEYEVVREVQVLRSTSGPIIDDWSAPSLPYPASGGATQFFVPGKAALLILD